MNVTHYSTGRIGGAGLAAFRTSESLMSIGVNSSFYSPKRDIILSRTDGLRNDEILKSKFSTWVQRNFIQSSSSFVSPVSKGLLSRNFPLDDVIHVHAFYNLFSSLKLLEIANDMQLFFTLHDERLLTGGCHYTNGCLGFKSDCSSCPQVRKFASKLVELEKRRINELLIHPNVRLIFPSDWLASKAQSFLGINSQRMVVLRNPIPSRRSLVGRDEIRNELGLSPKMELIGFVSKNLLNPLKGLDQLASALGAIPNSRTSKMKILLVGDGEVPDSFHGVKIIKMATGLKFDISDLMFAMDVLVVPSLQDNFPNVIGESLSVGTPVVGSCVGGIPEITESLGLPTFFVGDIRSLAQILDEQRYLISRDVLVSKAEQIFGYSSVATRLKNFYEQNLIY
jgi:glycosyltransferase involved in cell wall biosynthesis